MSVKLELYQDVKSRLEQLSFLRNVLHYNGQDLLDYEKDHSRRFPQAWIQLSNIPWKPSEQQAYNKNETHQQKSGEGLVFTVYYAIFSLKEDDDTFETDLVNIDLIYRALTMTEGDNYTPIQRINETDAPNNNNVRIWATEFTTMLTECPIAQTLVDAAPVELDITKEILP